MVPINLGLYFRIFFLKQTFYFSVFVIHDPKKIMMRDAFVPGNFACFCRLLIYFHNSRFSDATTCTRVSNRVTRDNLYRKHYA